MPLHIYIYAYILPGAVESRMREKSLHIASRQTPFPLFTFRQRARAAQDNRAHQASSSARAQRSQQRTYRERNAVCAPPLYACAPNFWTRFRLLNRNVYAWCACQSAAAGVMFEGYVCVLKRRERERAEVYTCEFSSLRRITRAACVRRLQRAPSPQGADGIGKKAFGIYLFFCSF